MDELRKIDEVDLAQKIILASEDLSEAYALTAVKRTYHQYSAWRRENYDLRWNSSFALYRGVVERRTWEGTEVPRAALSQPVVFDQVEAALPAIKQALFGSDPWFDVIPTMPTTGTGDAEIADIAAARDIRDHLAFLLGAASNAYGIVASAELEHAIKDVLIFGTGFIMLEIDPETSYPTIQWVDPRDIWVDPGTPIPSIDAARSIIHRRQMTIDELEGLRSVPGMKIPSREVLFQLAQNRLFTTADTSKQAIAAVGGINFNPISHADIPMPSDKLVDVFVYWSKSRVIWTLNLEYVAYNEKNPYGFIPYCAAPCYTYPSRFYGLSFADVIGDAQLYIQALRNLRLDELNLAISPPRIRKRGTISSAASVRWRPGQLIEVDNPKEDIVVQFPQNASANVEDAIAAIELSIEKRTGVNAIATGVPRPSNANRTASGMQMQMTGASLRLSTIVSHIEDYLLTPMLNKMYRMTQMHVTPDRVLPAVRQGVADAVPATAFYTPVRFEVRAASRMVTREMLQQAMPVLLQYLAQGPLMQELSRIQKTIDWMEVFRMIQDALGIRNTYNFIREMTEEEMQAMQQPDPKTMMDMQKAQLEADTRIKMGELKAQSQLQTAMLSHEAKTTESEEKSAREILKALFEEQNKARESEDKREQLLAQLAAKFVGGSGAQPQTQEEEEQ